jgi:tetratricopeptide (TPR) repeat protein
VELGKDDAVALYTGGFALARVSGALDEGIAFIDRAIAVNPNLAPAWLVSGWVRVCIGEPDVAIGHLNHAMRLSPLDPYSFGMQSGIAFAHLFARRYDEASSWAEKAIRAQPHWIPALRIAAASHALGARLEEAKEAMRRMRELDPELRVSNLKEVMPFRRAEDLALFAEGLRKAGLPE